MKLATNPHRHTQTGFFPPFVAGCIRMERPRWELGDYSLKVVFLCRAAALKKVKPLDFVREQGARPLKSGAYTIVREHFEWARNTALGQKMKVLEIIEEGPFYELPIHFPGFFAVTPGGHIGPRNLMCF